MRTVLLIPTTLLCLAIAAPATAATRDVRIVRAGFSPASVTINGGDTIRWTNRDTVSHQVVADSGAFVSPVLAPGRTFSFTFRAQGTYRYRDALEPTERGTIVVRGLPPSVSLAASAPVIPYGAAIRLSGVVSGQRAGEQVTIWAQPFGQASFVQVGVVMTAAGGAWDFSTAPNVLTIYQVRARGVASQPVTVQVRPKITLLPGKRGYFSTRVTAARSFAGSTVYLQRRTVFGQWVSVKRYTLGPRSGRIFKIPRRPGVFTYRIFLSTSAAGAGYVESWSGTQTVRTRS